jgi:hypothetical protein
VKDAIHQQSLAAVERAKFDGPPRCGKPSPRPRWGGLESAQLIRVRSTPEPDIRLVGRSDLNFVRREGDPRW